MTLLRAVKRLLETTMGKVNRKPKGKSARNGNRPAPYTKYNKTPYKYSAAYYDWHRSAKAGRSVALDWNGREKTQSKQRSIEAR